MDCSRVTDEDVYDYITDFQISSVADENLDYCYEDIDSSFNIVYFNSGDVPSLQSGYFEYQSIPKLYGLMQDNGLSGNVDLAMGELYGAQGSAFNPINFIESGILQVQGSPLNLSGKGVVVCFIDTGIDYVSEVFRDENGNSRIMAIWDQTIDSGKPPEGFLFGTEYTREQINEALKNDEPYEIVPSRDENGHGSRMASVAAGSRVRQGGAEGALQAGGSVSFSGAAYDSDIVVVKVKECKRYLRDFYIVSDNAVAYAENDIMLAVKYVDSVVKKYGKPVIICVGIGTNMGEHMGKSALSRYLSMVGARRGRGVVVCGGNEGNSAHHFSGKITNPSADSQQISTNDNFNNMGYQDVEINVANNNKGFWLELWGNLPDRFRVRVRTPGGESVSTIQLPLGQSITYNFIYEKSTLTVQSTLIEASSGKQLITFRLKEPTAGIWTFRVEGTGNINGGNFDMWLPISEFLSSEAYFLSPNPYTTMTEPAYGDNIISLTTYNTDNNGFYPMSGRGYAADNRIRPDICAPGVNISTYRGQATGSSMAAAITAGAAAMFFEWAIIDMNDILMDTNKLKNYFILGAKRSTSIVYPNREYGYGLLDIEGTFEALI